MHTAQVQLTLEQHSARQCVKSITNFYTELWFFLKPTFDQKVRTFVNALHTRGINLKTPVFRFRVDGKDFENGDFRKQWHPDHHVSS